MKTPDFSPFARQYAASRPRYPAELFECLASLAEHHDLAWDCATGNGQAALGLVERFERIIATDVSAEQIRQATPHPRIDYRVAPSERSGLDEASVDLATVASALHWFDLERFGSEVERVVRPGGVVAAWTYHVGHVEAPFERLFERFYREVVGPYFAPGAKLVDERYTTIPLPGQPLQTPTFRVGASWNLGQVIAFVRSWSGTQEYIRVRGEDPVDLIAGELERAWGDRERVRSMHWPLYLRAARL
jgi:SAM-dependent methyltransferase